MPTMQTRDAFGHGMSDLSFRRQLKIVTWMPLCRISQPNRDLNALLAALDRPLEESLDALVECVG